MFCGKPVFNCWHAVSQHLDATTPFCVQTQYFFSVEPVYRGAACLLLELGRCLSCVLCFWGAESSRPGLHRLLGSRQWPPPSIGIALTQGIAILCTQGHSPLGLWACTVPPKPAGRSVGSPCASWEQTLMLYHQLLGGCDIWAYAGCPSAERSNKLNYSSN